jgi:hypothetical protein
MAVAVWETDIDSEAGFQQHERMNRQSIILCLVCASCTVEKTDHTEPPLSEVEAGVADRMVGQPAEFMVEAALQATGKPGEVVSAVCSRRSPHGNYDCQYALAERPTEILQASVLQCDVAFYLEGCPEHLGQ